MSHDTVSTVIPGVRGVDRNAALFGGRWLSAELLARSAPHVRAGNFYQP